MNYNKLYDDVRFATELVKFAYLNGNAKSVKSAEEYLIKIKRTWRNHIHAKNGWERKYENAYVTILNGSIDGATIKLFFPNEHWDETEKKIFKEENWKRYFPSQYDCTGQIFTSWMRFFDTPSGMFAYIREDVDC